MLFRFCLYGFLKNQRYFEPFLVLAFLDKGLSFFQIGLLVGFRELCINLLEIPTGAVADAVGRRGSMVYSHVAYAASFILLGWAASLPWLFAAMFLFSIGDAFRTGTHKAIIFAWLEQQGRTDERTTIYGFTRSWSQMGSAVSVLIAAGIVLAVGDYSIVFWLSAVPAMLNVINFLTYPKSLDEQCGQARSFREVGVMLCDGVRQCFSRPVLRRLLAESAGFEGVYRVAKDYLQPIIRQAALAMPILLALDPERRTAVLVGVVYAGLYVLSSQAARRAGTFQARAGSDERAARWLWVAYGTTFAVLLVGTGLQLMPLAAACFVMLAVLQNLWRPAMIGRIAGQTDKASMATVLSLESQAKSLWAFILAPVLGFIVDRMAEDLRFMPVAVLGLVVTVAALVLTRKKK
jgi:MFS family permease